MTSDSVASSLLARWAPPMAVRRPDAGARRHLRAGQGGALLFLLTACAGPQTVMAPVPRPIAAGYEETGNASWYGRWHHGRPTASGEVYDMHRLTAAHRTLPLGARVLVENLDNGRTAQVTINDRGPYVAGRILDLSFAAAQVLGAVEPGVIPVRVRVIELPDVGRVAEAEPPRSTAELPPAGAESWR